MDARPLLSVRGVTVRRAGLQVVDGADLDVHAGRCLVLLGLNGAGKSSLLAAIAGVLPTHAGSIVIDGHDVTQRRSWDRCAAGLVLVPSGRELFANLTITDNLLVGGHLHRKRTQRRQALDRVFEAFPELAERRRALAGHLSGGQQQMLAIGRALMTSPRVLLLDEPSEGLAPLVVQRVMETIAGMKDSSIAILLAEQNAAALRVADAVVVMQEGRVSEARPASEMDVKAVSSHVFGA